MSNTQDTAEGQVAPEAIKTAGYVTQPFPLQGKEGAFLVLYLPVAGGFEIQHILSGCVGIGGGRFVETSSDVLTNLKIPLAEVKEGPCRLGFSPSQRDFAEALCPGATWGMLLRARGKLLLRAASRELEIGKILTEGLPFISSQIEEMTIQANPIRGGYPLLAWVIEWMTSGDFTLPTEFLEGDNSLEEVRKHLVEDQPKVTPPKVVVAPTPTNESLTYSDKLRVWDFYGSRPADPHYVTRLQGVMSVYICRLNADGEIHSVPVGAARFIDQRVGDAVFVSEARAMLGTSDAPSLAHLAIRSIPKTEEQRHLAGRAVRMPLCLPKEVRHLLQDQTPGGIWAFLKVSRDRDLGMQLNIAGIRPGYQMQPGEPIQLPPRQLVMDTSPAAQSFRASRPSAYPLLAEIAFGLGVADNISRPTWEAPVELSQAIRREATHLAGCQQSPTSRPRQATVVRSVDPQSLRALNSVK